MSSERLSFSCVNDTLMVARVSGQRWGEINFQAADRQLDIYLIYAPYGREPVPLSEREMEIVEWVLENSEEIGHSIVDAVHSNCAELLATSSSTRKHDNPLPNIQSREEVLRHISLNAIYIHHLPDVPGTIIGAELGCTWDRWGVGVLLSGSTVLRVGSLETAFSETLARQYASEPSGTKASD